MFLLFPSDEGQIKSLQVDARQLRKKEGKGLLLNLSDELIIEIFKFHLLVCIATIVVKH